LQINFKFVLKICFKPKILLLFDGIFCTISPKFCFLYFSFTSSDFNNIITSQFPSNHSSTSWMIHVIRTIFLRKAQLSVNCTANSLGGRRRTIMKYFNSIHVPAVHCNHLFRNLVFQIMYACFEERILYPSVSLQSKGQSLSTNCSGAYVAVLLTDPPGLHFT